MPVERRCVIRRAAAAAAPDVGGRNSGCRDTVLPTTTHHVTFYQLLIDTLCVCAILYRHLNQLMTFRCQNFNFDTTSMQYHYFKSKWNPVQLSIASNKIYFPLRIKNSISRV